MPPQPQASPLTNILAKSAGRGRGGVPELLTDHSTRVRDAGRVVACRIGAVGILATEPEFWSWVEEACLLHDAGKTAEDFQAQVRPGGDVWGLRHEILSLAYVEALYSDTGRRLMVATGVAFHHRPLRPCQGTDPDRTLQRYRQAGFDWERWFGFDAKAETGRRVKVKPDVCRAFLEWYAAQLGAAVPEPDGRKLWERARSLFTELDGCWAGAGGVARDKALIGMLLQGAVTLADRSASGGVDLQRHMPLPVDYLQRLPSPYEHQAAAGRQDGHLILRAPTGSGKTEAGLAWAARQLVGMTGEPRVVWTLPYRASIDAMRNRFSRHLVPAHGQDAADIGILHGKIAQTFLDHACDDETEVPGRPAAKRAVAEANAARLFAQRVRVSTPYQLLRGAIAGPSCSSILLEQANCLFVFDELHAYDAVTFGRLCATMRLWRELGSRIAVLSATLAPQLGALIAESIGEDVQTIEAPAGTAPDRHRLVVDAESIDSQTSVDRIMDWLEDGHSVLAVANTVATAQHLYTMLAPTARAAAAGDPDAAILLHSRFRARDRAQIERRLLARHPEREPGEAVGHRAGGLVVATQAVEVSLCLDFDRGVTEVAPIESVVQRMGRVNRRGLHPDGRVEFRVHASESPLPYGKDEVGVSWTILTDHEDDEISEQTLATWLAEAYDSEWGRTWLRAARDARDKFDQAFLNFTDPFGDRSTFADKLEENFDTVEVLLEGDLDEYDDLAHGADGHPLKAAGLLIPIRYSQMVRMRKAGLCELDRRRKVHVISKDVPYSEETGLDLSAPAVRRPESETVL